VKIFTNPINFIYIYLLVITKIPTTFLIACSNNHINMPIIIILVLVEIYWYFGTDMYAFYRDMMLRWRQSLNMFTCSVEEKQKEICIKITEELYVLTVFFIHCKNKQP